MKPLLFRFHKGVLKDSMSTVIIIVSPSFLASHITSIMDLKFKTINIQPYCYDERIDWDTYLVTGTVIGMDWEVPIGFLNRKPDWEEEQIIL